jgi:hypothetical protein
MLRAAVLRNVFKIKYENECNLFLGDGVDGILSNICMYNFPICFISLDCC